MPPFFVPKFLLNTFMSSDPRLNLSAYAQVNIGPITISIGAGSDPCSTSLSQNFLGGIEARASAALELPGNIGAFANLQLGVGGGTVGAGLANLAAISDSIRVNGPPTASNPQGLPTSTDPSAGREFVLTQVGLSSHSLSSVAQVNTSVAQSANVQADLVYNQVQSGTFTNENIPSSFSAFQNATQMLSVIFQASVSVGPQGSGFGEFCGAKPYAIDLINLAPKYKFLFVVQLEFDPEFQEIMESIDPAFVIKTSTRPQIDFEYQDVNMYNFRTKVPSKTVYQPMTMKFYDDDYNNAFQFYATYMKLMSPIANIDIESQAVDPLDAYDNVGGGMGFEQNPLRIQTGWSGPVGQGYAASLGPYGRIPTGGSADDGPFGTNVRNILRRITLFHVYKQGRMMNVYHFYNPKITAMTLDDLDMATTGEGNDVSLTFSYDSVYVIPGYSIINGPQYNLPSMTDDGIYPFGIEPGSISPRFNSKDGTGRGGLDYGQNNVLQNFSVAPSSAQFITTPAAVSNFNPTNPTTTSGTSLGNLPAAPALVGGGQDTSRTLQGNTSANLGNITVSGTTLRDPITGTIPNSADNSGNLGNVLGQNANTLNAINAAAAAAKPTTLAQSSAVKQRQQNATDEANKSATGVSTQFKGGGGGGGGGGASGSF